VLTDPISDYLTRIRNALQAEHEEVEIPSSRLKREMSRVSRPGRRRYVANKDVPRVFGGMGTTIVSTSSGVMTGHEARRRGVGGEVVAYVW
jgi:small subunit ribosomal protein S8